MSGSRLFFDPEDLRSRHFELNEPIRSKEGRRYELEEWIGRGGHNAVFACVDRSTGDEFAIKFLLTRGMKPSKRFLREVELLEAVDNDHVIKIRGSGSVQAVEVTNGTRRDMKLPFLVMDRAQCNLATLLAPDRARPAPEAYMGQFRGLAGALAELHDLAIHRDIKPENILVQGDKWLLSDYGLCAFHKRSGTDLTGRHEQIGPKYWLSPEAHNRRLGHSDVICAASDVYQMAAVFWYVATGRHPSGSLAASDWGGPSSLYAPIQRALMHDVNKRQADGRAFFNDITAALVA